MLGQEWLKIVSDPFLTFWSRVVATLPAVVGALILLLFGFMLGRGLRKTAEKLLAVIRLDEHTEKFGFNEILSRVGFGRSPSYIIGFLVYWLIVLVFIVSASNVLQLTVVSELLENLVLFIHKLIASMLILLGGLVFGHFAWFKSLTVYGLDLETMIPTLHCRIVVAIPFFALPLLASPDQAKFRFS